MDGFMIRYHARGDDNWKSIMDGSEVRHFKTDSEAHTHKEEYEMQNGSLFSYNVFDHDASAR